MSLDMAALTSDLVAEEGLKLAPYCCPAGKLTLGVGHNLEALPIPGYDNRSPITVERALALLDEDIDRVLRELSHALPWWPALDGVRQRALAQWAFQLGTTALVVDGRRTLDLIANGDYHAAADRMRGWLWAKQTPARAKRVIHMIEFGRPIGPDCPCQACRGRR